MAKQLLPFRQGTRQRFQKVGTATYSAASSLSSVQLPRVGLVNRIYVQFRGTVTLSGAGALSDKGPWNLLNRIKVTANIGAASIVDVSGYGGYLISRKHDFPGFAPDKAGVGDTTPSADYFAAPVAMGANTWCLTWCLPIAANDRNEFDAGMINLQAPEVQVNVDLTTGALLDPATLVTATTGTFHIYYEYYEIPDPTRFQLPPLVLCRTLEEQQPISAVGDNIYTVPRQGVLLNLMHVVTLNGARSDSFDSMTLRFNKTDSVYQMERQANRIQERVRNALETQTGSCGYDLFNAKAAISQGDTRDAVDTEELSTLESIVTVSSGATLGTNNNTLASIRRILQVLAA